MRLEKGVLSGCRETDCNMGREAMVDGRVTFAGFCDCGVAFCARVVED